MREKRKKLKKKKLPSGKHFVFKPSASEAIIAVLKKAISCPFEILLEMGKMYNQLSPGGARTSIHRLRRRNLVVCERRGKKLLFALTEEGERAASEIAAKIAMSQPKKWDGKWRIIIFDVPEKLRGKREILRAELKTYGFLQIQKSALAYPHPLPQEFIDFWRKTGILKHCIIFETDKIYGDDITHFDDRKKV